MGVQLAVKTRIGLVLMQKVRANSSRYSFLVLLANFTHSDVNELSMTCHQHD